MTLARCRVAVLDALAVAASILSTVLDILTAVATNGLTPEEFAQARAVPATDHARSANSHLLSALVSRPHVGDENVLTQQRRILELARLTPVCCV